MRIRKQKSLIDRAADYVDAVIPQLEAAFESARDQVAPVIAEGRAIAAEKVAPTAAKLTESHTEPKGSRLKKLLFIGGLLAIGGAVFAKLRQQSSGSNNWQSSYVPTPPPAPAAPVDEVVADDVAGSDPAEAISDAAESPHEVTTPDAPADVIELDEGDFPDSKP